jgi:hypothetical protein
MWGWAIGLLGALGAWRLFKTGATPKVVFQTGKVYDVTFKSSAAILGTPPATIDSVLTTQLTSDGFNPIMRLTSQGNDVYIFSGKWTKANGLPKASLLIAYTSFQPSQLQM